MEDTEAAVGEEKGEAAETEEERAVVAREAARTEEGRAAEAMVVTVDEPRAAALTSEAEQEPSKLESVCVQLADNLRLKPVQERLIEMMFDGYLKVDVTQMHGGLSGSLVLRMDGVDADRRLEEPKVMKLDTEKEMHREVAETRLIAQEAGEGVIEILRDPIYLDGYGAVLLEMAGACWVMPEFYSSNHPARC